MYTLWGKGGEGEGTIPGKPLIPLLAPGGARQTTASGSGPELWQALVAGGCTDLHLVNKAPKSQVLWGPHTPFFHVLPLVPHECI